MFHSAPTDDAHPSTELQPLHKSAEGKSTKQEDAWDKSLTEPQRQLAKAMMTQLFFWTDIEPFSRRLMHCFASSNIINFMNNAPQLRSRCAEGLLGCKGLAPELPELEFRRILSEAEYKTCQAQAPARAVKLKSVL